MKQISETIQQENNTIFEPFKTSEYNIIYVVEFPDTKTHDGCLKIGETTISSQKSIEQITQEEINKKAHVRIKQWTNTAGIKYNLLHAQLAIFKNKKEEPESYHDTDIHRILINSGIRKAKFEDSSAREWLKTDIETVKEAIKAKEANQNNLSGQKTNQKIKIKFRPEQKDAIDQTVKEFKRRIKNKTMLWNAKMRFGKTLSALEVIRQMKFKKTLIITHRPAVNRGWYEDFNKIFQNNDYIYGSKKDTPLTKLENQDKNYVYFISIQDLDGSKIVGGKFDKNKELFEINWDLVIIDEAHEGTQTELGRKIKKQLIKENTCLLELSGTPFNIIENHENIFTWDYVMEQEKKKEWYNKHNDGSHNPYAELPKMHIYTYSLGDILKKYEYDDILNKAFNFKEFFRTWKEDNKPEDKKTGDFVHEEDVESFLNLITKESETSQYPYSNEKFRKSLKHSLWYVPGVKEAKALSKLLKKHPVFKYFRIVNVAGDGDPEDPDDEALNKVKDAIDKSGEDGYTITLSCGKLTTGVTVPEWTSVLYLAGTSTAQQYLQTIFRVQSPCHRYGKLKTDCYVFDFAPERTLKIIAESIKISTKAGQTTAEQRVVLGEFLNYCPVISIDGTQMKPYSTSLMMRHLKRAYAEKVVQTGFESNKLYNDNLMQLTDIEVEEFEELKEILKTTKQQKPLKEITINDQQLSKEQLEIMEKIKNKPKSKRTKEDQEKLDKLNKLKKQKRDAISTLRAISIRMPLLIFGSTIPLEEDFTLEMFLDKNIIDDKSWEEFMPEGVTRKVFKKFIKYYDEDVLIEAGHSIRRQIKQATTMPIDQRVKEIAKIHSYFKNPDKETILTPWNIINQHLSHTIGGYTFYDDIFKEQQEEARYVELPNITENVFKNNTKILEINSKTGLYPLYIAYTLYKKETKNKQIPQANQTEIWRKIIEKNIYIISKTPMAEKIAKRTLLGYEKGKINSKTYDLGEKIIKDKKNKKEIEEEIKTLFKKDNEELIKQIKDRIGLKRIINGSIFSLKEREIEKEIKCMLKEGETIKFDAIVGNPPYQLTEKNMGNNVKPIYQDFTKIAMQLQPTYISLIILARWYSDKNTKDKSSFKEIMLNNNHIEILHTFADAKDIFPTVDIKGGICYFLIDKNYEGKTSHYYHVPSKTRSIYSKIDLGEFEYLIRDPRLVPILQKVTKHTDHYIYQKISACLPYGIPTNPTSKNKKIKVSETKDEEHEILLYYVYKNERKIGYVNQKHVTKNQEDINKYKVFVPKAAETGSDKKIVGKPILASKGEICSETFLTITFDTKIEAENFIKYYQTKFLRVLISAIKITQDLYRKIYHYVPMQNFTEKSDINWNTKVEEIDKQLYTKYNLSEEDIKYIEERIDPIIFD